MVSPGTLTALTALADGSTTEYEPLIDTETGDVSYPTVETHLNEGDPSAYEVLESLARREILDKTFEEKVYICPGCGAEGMRYTTACQGCGSAYTVETELFEHIECGHIAPREQFEIGPEEYVCPECETQFDSLEDIERGTRYVCQDCGSYFETPEHGLRCRDCTDIYAPSDAVERVLCRYSLTREGKQWVESQLAARESMVEMLEERGFETSVNTTVRAGSTEHPVHVYGEDALLGSRIVAGVHERPDGETATHLRDIAADADARPFLITTLGSVGEDVATLADRADMRILSAEADGNLRNDYQVTDSPRPSQSLVQRLASAVRQP
jgi:DNA-directed RNA polymerase subunit RPC12/RpoP